MRLIVVYPDNSVEINGETVKWKEEDFRRHGIETQRVKTGVLGSSESRQLPNGDELLIFPTQESPSEVYANAKYDVLNPGGRRGRVPGEAKKAQVEKQTHRGRPRRWHEYRGAVLYLECQGKSHNGLKQLPADEFNKSARQAFGRQGICRECQRTYFEERKANHV